MTSETTQKIQGLVALTVIFFGCGGPSKAPPKGVQPKVKITQPKHILPGKGIGDARIGMTLEQVVALFGEPEPVGVTQNESKHFAHRMFKETAVTVSFLKGKAYSMTTERSNLKTPDGLSVGDQLSLAQSSYSHIENTDDSTFTVHDDGLFIRSKDGIINSIGAFASQTKTVVESGIDLTMEDDIPLSEVMDVFGLPMFIRDSTLVYHCLKVVFDDQKGTVKEYVDVGGTSCKLSSETEE